MKKVLLAVLALLSAPALADSWQLAAIDRPAVYAPVNDKYFDLLADVLIPLRLSASASPINASLVCTYGASQVSPLAVVCDTTATLDPTVTSKPFHDIQVSWNYGDPNVVAAGTCGAVVVAGEGFWRCGAQPGLNSKNTASTPIGAHVYEITEGGGNKNFTITATYFDGVNTRALTQSITVKDPATVYAGKTNCYKNAAGSVDASCPASGTVVGSTSAFSLASCTTGIRCLFKAGDSFASASSQNIASDGVTIGAYGSGAQPIITSTNLSQGVIKLSANDIRVIDLNVTGAGPTDTGAAIVPAAPNVTNPLILRNTIGNQSGTQIDRGIIISGSGVNNILGGIIQDNWISGLSGATSGAVGIYGYARISAFLGNMVGPFAAGAEHNIRCQPCQIVDISYNSLTTPGTAGKQVLTIRAIEHTPDAIDMTPYAMPDTQYVHMGDNKLDAGTSSVQMFQVAPAGNTQNNWIYDVIAERNWIKFGAVTQAGYYSEGVRLTVRDNLCDATGGAAFRTCFSSSPSNTAGAPFPDDNRFYNNTCFSGDTSTSVDCIWLNGAVHPISNSVVQNNLAYATFPATPHLLLTAGTVTGTVPTCTTSCASNSSNSQMKSTDPNFTSTSPFNPANAKPTSGYAIGGGVAVPVWADLLGVSWAGSYDIGAVKH